MKTGNKKKQTKVQVIDGGHDVLKDNPAGLRRCFEKIAASGARASLARISLVGIGSRINIPVANSDEIEASPKDEDEGTTNSQIKFDVTKSQESIESDDNMHISNI